ncbi:hypothetical protein EUTSA_v10029047mg [Eutrema salsugineum]|uniref:Uncharacterized protein n=1 Tax=Eutrema salsugineum TaxID=72664 RepID=V4LD49_EUTSA|nr:uncharacterized protein LOC18015230 [Eutrema salsugineum]ESQ37703.1 hypothetical protein EUTSA_v10029047mg [Eutrema salsugineum]
MALDPETEPEVDLDEGDLEKLESDVRQMAKKISDYRQTLPDHLRNTLDSAISSHRPVLRNIGSGSGPLPPSRLTIAETEVAKVVMGSQEQDSAEKMVELKERMSRNAANIPKVVKRVRECIEGIHKIDSFDGTIHPAFTRRRLN